MTALAAALVGCGGGDPLPGDLSPGSPMIDVATVAGVAPLPPAAAASAPAGAAVPASAPGTSLSLNEQPHDAEVRSGDFAQFDVKVDGSAGASGVTYQWLHDGDPIEGAIGATLQLRVGLEDHLSRFNVIVSSGGVSIRSAAALLRVTPR